MSLHTIYKQCYSKYSNDDYEWVHYVHDHYARLRAKAAFIEMNEYKMHELHYRLTDFLEEHNVPKEVDWIVLYINQLASEKDFKSLTWMYLPDMTDLELMRDEFDTVKAHTMSVRRRN